MLRHALSGAALMLGVLAATNWAEERKAGDVLERKGEPPVLFIEGEDPKMVAAIKKARADVKQFTDALAKPKTTHTSFAVKVMIVDGKFTEHMWLTDVRYKDGKFSGVLNNEPNDVKTVKIGDKLSASEKEISDWMYVDGRKLVGGYTIRLLRDGMTAEQRTQFDQSIPFVID